MADNGDRYDPYEPWILACFSIALPFFIWFAQKDLIIGVSLFLLKPQFWFYTNITPFLVPDSELVRMEYFLRDSDYLRSPKVSFGALVDVWHLAGIGARWLALPIFCYWVLKLLRKPTKNDFTRLIPRDQLVHKMSPYFSNLPPILDENIHKLPLHVGPWRIPRSYLNLACEQQLLLYKEREVFPHSAWTHKEMSLPLRKRKSLMADQDYLSLDKQKTDDFFRARLGSKFTTFDEMPTPHMKAICGLYCALIAKGSAGLGEVADAERLLSQSFRMKGSRKKDGGQTFAFDSEPGIALLEKYGMHEDVLEVLDSHSFNITVVMGLYSAASELAKVTTNTIIWCRPLDNRLYRCLVQLGGRAAIPDVSAEWAHFHCEKKWGKKIEDPLIEGATDALEQSLVSEGWIVGPAGMSADPFQSFLGKSLSIAKGEVV
jgi:hypothetical protein